MRKSGLIVLFSLFAFVLLIVGAGAATAIVLKDHDSPGKSKSSMEPIDDHSKITFQEFQQLMEENDIDIYYFEYGDPQNEYISSHHSINEYYTGGGEDQYVYMDSFDATDLRLWISWSFHMNKNMDINN